MKDNKTILYLATMQHVHTYWTVVGRELQPTTEWLTPMFMVLFVIKASSVILDLCTTEFNGM